LQGKITDPEIAATSVGDLGSAYSRMGRLQRAMVCCEEALRRSRENHDRRGEGVWLGNLGNCLADIGQTARAVDMYEQALQVDREVGDRKGESTGLSSLGIVSLWKGRFARAIDYHEQAIKIDRKIGNKADLALDLANLGECYILLGKTVEAIGCFDEALAVARETSHRLAEGAVHSFVGELEIFVGNYKAAMEAFEKAIEIGDDIGSAQLQSQARYGTALASLLDSNLASARRLIEAARQYHFPLLDVHNPVLLGVVAYRQRDLSVAKQAFAAAIDQADALLAMTPERYAALDAKAIALCGLTLCGDTKQTLPAQAAFRAARAITSAEGVVHKALQLFDALALGDESHLLVDMRPAAAGDSPEGPN